MASKAIYEADAKSLIYKFCQSEHLRGNNLIRVCKSSVTDDLHKENEWLQKTVRFPFVRVHLKAKVP